MPHLDEQNPDNFEVNEQVGKYKEKYALVVSGVCIAILILLGFIIFSSPHRDYWINVYVTGVGIIFAVAIIDRRAEQRAIKQRKEELILQMGSSNNAFAKEATRLLRQKGWLTDGSLIGKRFVGANLWQANLVEAQLMSTQMIGANLRSAGLHKANLEKAALSSAKLSGAYMWETNLRNAMLDQADLQQADLLQANLEGAILFQADLRGTKLDKVNLKGAILPDGTVWTPERDLHEFTEAST